MSKPEISDFNQAQMKSWVERQVAFGPRRPGSPGGQANESFLEEEMHALGLRNVTRDAIEVQAWNPTQWSLRVGPETFEAFPIPHARFTEAEGVKGNLKWVSSRQIFGSSQWRGKIIVAEISFPEIDCDNFLKMSMGRYDPRQTMAGKKMPAIFVRQGWHLYQLAARWGAAAFVGILKDQPGGTCQMYAPYGFREKNICDKPIPGLWVGKALGESLKTLAREGAVAEVTSLGTAKRSTTSNIVGEIPGESNKTIIVSSHHDSPFDSPVEDGTGVAVVLALAKYFASRPRLKHTLKFLFTAGHFYGSIGTRTYIEKNRPEIGSRTTCAISIEHVAMEAEENSSGKLAPSGEPEISVVFVPFNKAFAKKVIKTVETHDFERLVLLPAEGPLGNYPPTDGGDWYHAKVPVMNFISNPSYLLTSEDGFGWVDWERLPKVAAIFADLILQIDEEVSPSVEQNPLAKIDCPSFYYAMKALRLAFQGKNTWFGLKPLH